MHSTDSIHDAACDWYGDHPIPVAGPGAPLVAEFSIAEFATAIGLPTEVGKAYVGEALELRHRLPKTWAQVLDGNLPAWRARRIARATIAPVPRSSRVRRCDKVASCAHTIRTTALDRLIATAITQFMPAEAEARQQAAADGRHVDIDTRHHDLNGLSGTATLHGTLDLADALDLEAAVGRRGRAAQGRSVPRTPSTCAAPSPSARSPDASSPSICPVARWLRRLRSNRLETPAARTPTDPSS